MAQSSHFTLVIAYKMDRYSIHTLINNGIINVDFVERNFKLNDGDILVGTSAFPEVKHVGNLFNFLDDNASSKVFKSVLFTITPVKPYLFNLYQWLDDNFPSYSRDIDKGYSITVDFYFRFNHYYENGSGEQIIKKHYAGSAQKQLVFTIFKSRVSSAPLYTTSIDMMFFKGKWVEYNSASQLYYAILQDGVLLEEAFPVGFSAFQPNELFLNCENGLRSHSGFSIQPNYAVDVDMRMTVLEFSNDDHTMEIYK